MFAADIRTNYWLRSHLLGVTVVVVVVDGRRQAISYYLLEKAKKRNENPE